LLLPILLALSLLPSQQASTHCVDTGIEIASSQTQPLRGTAGVAAVFKVSTADDHSKNPHDCNAEYQLLVTHARTGAPVVVDLHTSDADYDRIISLRTDVFSQDGKQLFEIFSEGGKYPATTLFEYSAAEGQVRLIDLRKQFAHMIAAKCGTTFEVIGTTETGAIAVQLDSAEKCSPNNRSLVNPASGRPQPLPKGASILSLYKSKTDAP
jgi:hypothetical protein